MVLIFNKRGGLFYMEKWKPIIGYKNIYKISDIGRVKSLSRKGMTTEKILRNGKSALGYSYVILSKNGNKKHHTIHRLVAVAFIKNLKNKPCVNHMNGVKADNTVENLEWCTHSENQLHAFEIGLRNGDKFRKKVKIIKNNRILEFDSISEAADFICCNHSDVSCVLTGRQKTTRGWKAEYQKEE
jgi:hypothetical protein